jgi:hypothetical protein
MMPGPQLSVILDRAELRPDDIVSGTVTTPFRLDGFTSARVDIGYETTQLVDSSPLADTPVLSIAADVASLFYGSGSGDSMQLVRRWVPVAGAELSIPDLNSGAGRFQVAVPAGVPATAAGVASWLIWARASRPDRYEVAGSAALRILRTAQPDAELAVTNHNGAGSVELVLPVPSVMAGEALFGSVRLTLPKQFDVKRISVRIGADLISSAHRLPSRYAALNAVESVLLTEQVVGAGWREWPFELRVPADAEPTSRAEKAWQRWWVTAEVDYSGLGNRTNVTRREVIVYNSR